MGRVGGGGWVADDRNGGGHREEGEEGDGRRGEGDEVDVAGGERWPWEKRGSVGFGFVEIRGEGKVAKRLGPEKMGPFGCWLLYC